MTGPGQAAVAVGPDRTGPVIAPVVGRRDELAWLAEWYDRTRTYRASRAQLVGPGGIGKTAVVDAFASGVEGAVVVRVEVVPDARPGALLDQLLAALDPTWRHAGSRAAAPEEAGRLLLAGLGERQDEGPLVVVVHDIHDADDASAQVLARTFRRLVHDRVLLVATARPRRLAASWSRLFADGPDAGTRVLGGLDEAGVRELVRRARPGRWSRSAIARLHGDTAGHPLHLTTLLRELPDEVLLGDAPLPAPRSLAQEVGDVVGRLSPGAHRLLACLAVLARPVDRSLLARLEELAPEALAEATHELVGTGLVEAAAGSTLSVHHPLVGSAIYETLAPDERSRLHLDAARAVGGTAALTHRIAAAAGRPDPGLADELEASARADTVDVRGAATRLLAAAELSPTGAEAERRLLAAALRLVDAYETDRLLALAPAARAASPGPERDVVLGYLTSQEHDPAAAVHLQTALDTEDGDGEVRALAGVRLALEHIFRGRGASADEAAARVPGLTRNPVRAEQAAVLRAIGRAQDSGPDAGLALLGGQVEGALGADPAITAGTLLLAAGRPTEARVRLEEGLARVQRGASSTSTHRAHCHLVEVLWRTGRWDLAEAEADVALDWFADGDLPWAEPVAHAVAALVPAARGRTDRAVAHLDAARAALARTFSPQGAHAIALAGATLARARGDGARMERVLRDLPTIAARGGMASAPFAPWRPLHAEALVESGDLTGARRVLRAWPRSGAPLWFRLARQQVAGRIALAAGDATGAETALRAGTVLADRHGAEIADECPVELAELQVLLGTLPHVEDGPELLAAAHPVFDALSATPWLDRIRLAAHDPGPSITSGGTLTPRERQVAGLVGQGMTSREVAEVLWVTQKAVDYHLGNVYSKLGITSRRQLRGRTFA